LKTIVNYQFETTDPPRGFVTDSVDQLGSFIAWDAESKTFSRGADAIPLKSLNRIFNDNEFSESDIRIVAVFLNDLAVRACNKFADVSPSEAIWRYWNLKAAEDAIAAKDRLLNLFYHLAPNLKIIAAESAQNPPTTVAPIATTATPNPTENKP
jgi:hypothetical protein